MNLINRTLIVILLLLGIVFACVSVIVLLAAREGISTTLKPTLDAVSSPQLGLTQLFCIGVAILVFAFSLLLLYLELMPGGKTRMRLKSIQGADVMMSSDAITTQLQYALEPLPGVIRAHPKVTQGKDDAVDVTVDLMTTADINVKQKTDEVMDMTRAVLEGGLGLRVGKVQIKLDQMRAPKTSALNLPNTDLQR